MALLSFMFHFSLDLRYPLTQGRGTVFVKLGIESLNSFHLRFDGSHALAYMRRTVLLKLVHLFPDNLHY